MEKKIYGVIYGLIDGTNDFEYIGQTTRSVELRFKEHAKDPYHIGSAIRAHGEDMFVIVILKVCYSKAELDFWEKHFIKSRDTMSPNGYNLTEGGEGNTVCDETRKKLSAIHKGVKKSPEHRAKIGAAHKGKKVPDETRAKLSVGRTGKKHSAESIAKMSSERTGEKNSFFGKHHTDETISKVSAIRRGNSPYKNLISELDARQWSYNRLVKLLSLSQPAISQRMQGKTKFTSDDIEKLVEIFGKPAEYLLERDDGKNSVSKKCGTPYKNLLAEMKERQFTYTALAKILGLSQATVSSKMSGKENFTAEQVAKLVETFGKPADYLLSRDDGLSATLSEAEKSANRSAAQRTDIFYKNLLCEMDKRNLSYGELAKLLGLCHQSVSLKMRGKVKFTGKDKVKLVEIFGKPAEYLLMT